MDSSLKVLRPWLVFGGSILVMFVLAETRELLVPIAIAVLLAFLLTPVVAAMQRRIGRVAAVLVVVIACTAALTAITLFALQEISTLADRLPDYRGNIRTKVADVRGLTEDSFLDKIEAVASDVQKQFEKGKAKNTRQVVVAQSATAAPGDVSAVMTPALDVLADAGIVFVLTIFMLLERQHLRHRIVRFVGHRRVAMTTRAFDEAGRRVSRYLLAQLLVNTIYGVVVGVGLYLLDVPHALLWGMLATLLRFVPYIGPWIAAIPPIFLSLAVAPGWIKPGLVIIMFIVLELFTNLVLETVFYAGVVGLSQVGLLVAVLFWSWLWGPAGLLLAAPITVCLVVLGKHVHALRFVSDLMTDDPTLDAPGRYYQRLLAGDQVEAADILKEHMRLDPSPQNVYDALMVPALSFAERDVAAGVLDNEEEAALQHATGQLLDDIVSAPPDAAATEEPGDTPPILAFPVNQGGDTLALRMLAQMMQGTSLQLHIGSARSLHTEILAQIQSSGSCVICIADLPPSVPSKTRYLVHRLRAAVPHLRIVVGRWAHSSLADESTEEILAAGADHVSNSLADTRQWLCQMRGLKPPPQKADTLNLQRSA
jgi:predicted PurR-regulated permease PerM